jgi:hypothetical protein
MAENNKNEAGNACFLFESQDIQDNMHLTSSEFPTVWMVEDYVKAAAIFFHQDKVKGYDVTTTRKMKRMGVRNITGSKKKTRIMAANSAGGWTEEGGREGTRIIRKRKH